MADGLGRLGKRGRELVLYHFPALAVRNFRLFLGGQSISVVGTWMQGPVLSWIAYEMTRSEAALGWVSFCGQLPMTVLALYTGVVADRYQKRMLVLLSQAALMIIAFGLGTMAALGILTITAIYVFQVLGGIARALDVPTRQAFVMDVAGRDTYTNAVALNSVVFNSARVVGPAVGTWLLAAVGAAACFYLNSASYIAILAALFLMKGVKSPVSDRSRGGLAEFTDGVRYVAKNGPMLRMLVLWSAHSLFGSAYITLLPVIARQVYGVEARSYGLLISSQGAGALVAAFTIAATARTGRPERWVVGGLALFCAILAALAFTTSYTAAMILIAVYGFAMVSFLVSGNIFVQLLSPDELRGRMMGVRTFVFGGLQPIGALVAGYMAEAFGALWAVKLGAAVLAVAFAAFAPALLRVNVRARQAQ